MKFPHRKHLIGFTSCCRKFEESLLMVGNIQEFYHKFEMMIPRILLQNSKKSFVMTQA